MLISNQTTIACALNLKDLYKLHILLRKIRKRYIFLHQISQFMRDAVGVYINHILKDGIDSTYWHFYPCHVLTDTIEPTGPMLQEPWHPNYVTGTLTPLKGPITLINRIALSNSKAGKCALMQASFETASTRESLEHQGTKLFFLSDKLWLI